MQKKRQGFNRNEDDTLNISKKANWILNIILIGLLLILLRVGHLAIIQHDSTVLEAAKPQHRQITESPKRGTIRDRFNVPLAFNKIQYRVAVTYAQIKQIRTVEWQTDSNGKRFKRYKRKEYIAKLSQMLARELGLDGERIEDLIHAKASFYNRLPFVIKESISEQEYYRLKMLERDWPGLTVLRMPKRHYPLGKVAGDVIGYMGAINEREYEAIVREIKDLENLLELSELGEIVAMPPGITSLEQVTTRLADLHELAYTINDSIGKAGVEATFEKTLRGFRGKKHYHTDASGNLLRELPGAFDPFPGKRIILTLSAELQEYAEQLLAQNEKIRQTRLSRLNAIKTTIISDKDPWIKGGAIVAMDPNTGEILALASHPRFDPNDFVGSGAEESRKMKRQNVQKWLENENYIADIWNQQCPLEREVFKKHRNYYIEEMPLTWDNYLSFILSTQSPLRDGERTLFNGTLQDAVTVQTHAEKVLDIFSSVTFDDIETKIDPYQIFDFLYRNDEDHEPRGKRLTKFQLEKIEQSIKPYLSQIDKHKRILDPYIGNCTRTYDQVLFIDLCLVACPQLSESLLAAVGKQSLSDYKEHAAAMVQLYGVIKKMTKDLFHDLDFKIWRKENEQSFLKNIRLEEKANHLYAKPYIDYLDGEENEQFQKFWDVYRWQIFESFLKGSQPEKDSTVATYLEHFRTWHQDIENGAHKSADWAERYTILANTVKNLNNDLTAQYLQSLRGFSDLTRPLIGSYRTLRKNHDHSQQEKHLAAAFYPKYGFGYGRSQGYRQAATQGSLFKLVTAYEALVQRYHHLQESGQDLKDLNPLKMVDLVFWKGKELYLGYHANNQPIPRNYKGGRLPRSAMAAIGTVDLQGAIETSSNPYFSILAGDILHSPNDLVKAAKLFSFGRKTGIDLPCEIPGKLPNDLETNRTGLYACAIGQHTLVVTPLQTSVMLSTLANGGKVLKPQIVKMIIGKDPRQHVNLVTKTATEVQEVIFLPDAIRKILLDGMCRVVARTHSESLKSLTRLYEKNPEAINDYVEYKHRLLGKTSTSESIENIDLDPEVGTNLYTHVWFGGIAYDNDVVARQQQQFVFRDAAGKPELVVVVYLRYGGYGKEGGPIAAQMAKKWKEIVQRKLIEKPSI